MITGLMQKTEAYGAVDKDRAVWPWWKPPENGTDGRVTESAQGGQELEWSEQGAPSDKLAAILADLASRETAPRRQRLPNGRAAQRKTFALASQPTRCDAVANWKTIKALGTLTLQAMRSLKLRQEMQSQQEEEDRARVRRALECEQRAMERAAHSHARNHELEMRNHELEMRNLELMAELNMAAPALKGVQRLSLLEEPQPRVWPPERADGTETLQGCSQGAGTVLGEEAAEPEWLQEASQWLEEERTPERAACATEQSDAREAPPARRKLLVTYGLSSDDSSGEGSDGQEDQVAEAAAVRLQCAARGMSARRRLGEAQLRRKQAEARARLAVREAAERTKRAAAAARHPKGRGGQGSGKGHEA